MLQQHAEKIQELCAKHRFYISIRDTGALSLQRLREGYAAKGHHILDKSLKEKSLDAKETVLPSGFSRDQILGMCGGFVGYWQSLEQKKQPLGVRTVGKWQLKRSAGGARWSHIPGPERYDHYVTFQDIKTAGHVPPDAYTGDYDMHEILVSAGSGRFIRAVSTPDDVSEERMLFQYHLVGESKLRMMLQQGFSIGAAALINNSIRRSRNSAAGLVEDKFAQVIQHGAQHNYPAFMLTQERDHKSNWVPSLIRPDPPVIVFYPDRSIRILKKNEEIFTYLYGHAHCHVSRWWTSEQERIQDKLTRIKVAGRWS
ncbi:hypothetical protein [Hyalangium sp.]|uniref:hypothetical protein n=1 Tax=Hyalangium sp. TaxID=2028555 RepID=UPI002D62C5BE|nr:hypothetical protein [Hyalangium sp.]HYH97052.1 hypothetical protein [Hyalangium sp.]